jgi:hypothetical protein
VVLAGARRGPSPPPDAGDIHALSARAILVLVFAAAVTHVTATPAHAQRQAAFPLIVVDVRGVSASLGQDAQTAADLGIESTSLASRALGGAVGAQIHVLRRKTFAFGLGVEALYASANSQPVDDTGQPIGPPIDRRLQGVLGGISINFGSGRGWSYLSGGIGPVAFGTYASPRPGGEPLPTELTQHFGGGARWFTRAHLAVGFDVRFYLTRPEVATAETAGRNRQRVVVIGIGVTFR